MNLLKSSLITLACAGATLTANAELTITELMQSNISGVIDDTNEFPDSWVELYNDGTEAINLQDYHIGIKKKIDSAYRLPDMTLEPGRYLLVYCDKGDSGLHTPFRLESNKAGDVYLFKGGEQLLKVSHPAFPAPDIAYGLDPVTGEWGYEFTATPGAANLSGVCDADHILPAPLFSTPGRVSTEPLSLTLSLPDDAPEGAAIYYTLDGSLPTAQSTLYTEPIELNASATVRAITAAKGWLSPFAVTQSYIMPDHEISLSLPVISITTDTDYLYSDDMGIYSDHLYTDNQANYTHDWRRPINIEFFFDHHRSDINQLCETRISGGYTRKFALKTFAIYANKRFGNKRFDYEFFPDQRPGLTDYPSLLLRNGGNDFVSLHYRDASIQMNVAANCDIDYQAYRPAVVYINGEYTGILNIRERSNEDNIVTNYDGLEDIHMLENWAELKAGDMQVFQDFKTFYNTSGHEAEEYEALMDVDEFFNLFISQIYYDNNDFPYNNAVLWRPTEEGGRWRWLMKDTDASMGLSKWQYTEPTLTRYVSLHENPKTNFGTQLFFNILENETLRKRFTDMFAVYMGDFLNAESTGKYLDANEALIHDEFPYHCAMFANEELKPEVDKSQRYLTAAKNWLTGRNAFLSKHIAEFFELGAPAELMVRQPADLEAFDADRLHYTINGVPVNRAEFEGRYFSGSELTVNISDEEADKILSWKYVIYKGDESEKGYILGNVFNMEMPECDRMEITPRTYITGIESVTAGETMEAEAEYYNLQGIRIDRPAPGGIYIVRHGTTARKVLLPQD